MTDTSANQKHWTCSPIRASGWFAWASGHRPWLNLTFLGYFILCTLFVIIIVNWPTRYFSWLCQQERHLWELPCHYICDWIQLKRNRQVCSWIRTDRKTPGWFTWMAEKFNSTPRMMMHCSRWYQMLPTSDETFLETWPRLFVFLHYAKAHSQDSSIPETSTELWKQNCYSHSEDDEARRQQMKPDVANEHWLCFSGCIGQVAPEIICFYYAGVRPHRVSVSQ